MAINEFIWDVAENTKHKNTEQSDQINMWFSSA